MKEWSFYTNPFLKATANSFSNAYDLSLYHDSALASRKDEPDIQTLYDAFHPVHLSYVKAYDTWKTHENDQKAWTLRLNELLRILAKDKIKGWDVKIQNVYKQGSPDYKRLLSNRRKPFQRGKQILLIEAVETLQIQIGDNPLLADVKADVDAFNAKLQETHTLAKGSISSKMNMNVDLEYARIAMCKAMFANLGMLIWKYHENPVAIDSFFRVELVRRKPQRVFTGSLKPGQLHLVAKRTFNAGDQVILSNLSHAKLKFYLTKMKGEQPGTHCVEMEHGEQTVSATELGDLSGSFLTVLNTDPDIMGRFEVEII